MKCNCVAKVFFGENAKVEGIIGNKEIQSRSTITLIEIFVALWTTVFLLRDYFYDVKAFLKLRRSISILKNNTQQGPSIYVDFLPQIEEPMLNSNDRNMIIVQVTDVAFIEMCLQVSLFHKTVTKTEELAGNMYQVAQMLFNFYKFHVLTALC